jgi:hypothetical protein
LADIVYNQGAHRIMAAAIAGTALDLRAAYTFGVGTGIDNRDLNFVSEVDALTNVSISTSRQALTGEASTIDEANDRANVDSGDITFPAHATETPATSMIIYNEGASDAARELVACYTTGFPQPVNGGLVVTVNDFLRASTV